MIYMYVFLIEILELQTEVLVVFSPGIHKITERGTVYSVHIYIFVVSIFENFCPGIANYFFQPNKLSPYTPL